MTEMAVGEVRARVLADHAKLRTAIAEVDRLAYAVSAEEVRHVNALREQAENLYRMLAEHIDHEDAVLAPIIRRIDAGDPCVTSRCETITRTSAPPWHKRYGISRPAVPPWVRWCNRCAGKSCTT